MGGRPKLTHTEGITRCATYEEVERLAANRIALRAVTTDDGVEHASRHHHIILHFTSTLNSLTR